MKHSYTFVPMTRKRWTAKTEVDESLLQFREKRKWQIALRRYVLEKNKSSYYAPFFGLDIEQFRQWIEYQFDGGLAWDNFSEAWQFDHIVPVAYFDFGKEDDMRLCWNFINIRVQNIAEAGNWPASLDALAAKTYFQRLLETTGYPLCNKMVEKIAAIEAQQIGANTGMPRFILDHKDYLEAVKDFTSEEYDKLNTGTSLEEVVFERNFLRKFGS
jgi:hypothetical protein